MVPFSERPRRIIEKLIKPLGYDIYAAYNVLHRNLKKNPYG